MPQEELPDTPLERLRKKLYSRTAVDGVAKSTLGSVTPNAPQHWSPDPLPQVPKKRMSTASLFLIFSVGFFFIAGITTAVVLFLGGRSVSSDHLEVVVEEGPVTVPGGKATSFTISLTNNNPLPVTGGTFTMLFPDGTVEADDASVVLTHYSEDIGAIAPGETVEKNVRAAFFGSENQKLTIPISVEYKTENSNATFTKKITHEFTISSSPVTLTATVLKEVSTGQPITIKVRARSNASETLKLVAIQAEYPFGFTPTAESPKPQANGLFVFDSLDAGEEKEIAITGPLFGQEGEERVFRFTAGALKSKDSREFGVPYMVTTAQIKISKPFLAVDLQLNRSSDETLIVSAGETISGLLTWVNTFSATVSDAVITVRISGDAFDQESVEATGGFYRSSDKTILYNRDTTGTLGKLLPNDTGNGTFLFNSKVGSGMDSLRNPTMTLDVSVSGRRVGAGNVPETITSTLSRTVKIQSALTLASKLVRSTGTITNTGPLPPKVDTESTYTVMLTARNSVNAVANTTVRVKLPSFVRFTGTTTVGDAITYTESTREVVWNVGDLPAGSTREGAFQVAFLPSSSQKGTSPILIPSQTISGFDRFVGKDITSDAPPLNTQIRSDPTYQDSYGTVQP